ncbi:tetratricopeptide repeat protein [Pleionea sediminis]|uniref:tetratricopeptide repeat protein n=1 Tax=Pleionea sediminis TaxID=2569479 RepID=UPI00118540D8|nr:hypothetical protein [Pleionea sediminis]
MAMKFGKAINIIGVVSLCALLVACSTTTKKSGIALLTNGEQAANLISTEKFLPYLSIDEETGKQKRYSAKRNPYLAEKGQLDKAVVTLFIKAKQAVKSKQVSTANKTLDQLISMNNKLSGPWMLKGELALQSKDLDTAVEHFAKAIEVNKNNVNAYIKLAKTQRLLGRFIHAQNTYAKALVLWPDFPEAHLNLAVLYDLYLNKPVLAQQHLEAYDLLASTKEPRAVVWMQELQERNNKPNYIQEDIALKLKEYQMQLAENNKKESK